MQAGAGHAGEGDHPPLPADLREGRDDFPILGPNAELRFLLFGVPFELLDQFGREAEQLSIGDCLAQVGSGSATDQGDSRRL